jgi:hypothetical protein
MVLCAAEAARKSKSERLSCGARLPHVTCLIGDSVTNDWQSGDGAIIARASHDHLGTPKETRKPGLERKKNFVQLII